MTVKVSYSHARDNLADLWEEVENSREAALIQRRGHEEMALIPADELTSLRETAYLLGSHTNRKTALRVLDLVEAPLRDPHGGIGKPEHLKHLGGDVWSRRINEAD